MGSFKSFALAGVFAVAASASALSADLLPPPPPMPYAPPPLEFAGGWYLRGDVGIGIIDMDKVVGVNVVGPVGSYTALRHTLDDQVFVGAGVGYKWNSWIRFDVTGEYRTAASFSSLERDNLSLVGGNYGYNKLDGKLSSFVGLANAYIDLGTWHGITPFIGAGVGFASHRIHGLTDTGLGLFAGGIGHGDSKTQTEFAWALHAGLGYAVTPNLQLELAYRYLNMGDVQAGVVNCLNPCGITTSYKLKEVDSHDIKLGMRWLLAAPPPPVYDAPIIRKY